MRTFRRLENPLALCTLAYSCFAHVLPNCGEETRRLLKTMKDSLGDLVHGRFHPLCKNPGDRLPGDAHAPGASTLCVPVD
ncbi:MAG: hypothetical protein ACI4Q3_02065 [Kiritimatiellia bacterium]